MVQSMVQSTTSAKSTKVPFMTEMTIAEGYDNGGNGGNAGNGSSSSIVIHRSIDPWMNDVLRDINVQSSPVLENSPWSCPTAKK